MVEVLECFVFGTKKLEVIKSKNIWILRMDLAVVVLASVLDYITLVFKIKMTQQKLYYVIF